MRDGATDEHMRAASHAQAKQLAAAAEGAIRAIPAALTDAGLPPPPSRPKARIDQALREWTHFTILDADKVRDLLLDLRAEV